jgi:hypothetical protein
MAEVPGQSGAVIGAGGLRFADTIRRFGVQSSRGRIEHEFLDSTNTSLVVHCLYDDGDRELRHPGGRRTCGVGDLFAVDPLFLLLFSGLYMFALPYTARRRSAGAQE